MHGRRRRRRTVSAVRHALTTFAAAQLSLLLDGCGGSQLDAGYAVPANAAVQGRGASTALPGADPTTTAADPASAGPTAPGAVPSYFGLFAWSAARLLLQEAAAPGGELTRANLVARMRQVHDWTGNGLHAPQDVGDKVNSNCWRFLRLQGGRWTSVGGSEYLCRGAIRVG